MELLLYRVVLLSALFSAWCAAQQRTGDGRVILNLGYLAAHEGNLISSGTIPAAQLAVDRINNDSHILPNYYLQLQADFDTKCVEDSGVFEYFRFWTSTNRNQTAPVFLGAGCTAATKPIATAARFWRTLQVSYLSTAPILSDNMRFPYLVRALPSETSAHKAQGIIVSQFGWEEVTIFTQNEEIFVSDIDAIMEFMHSDLHIGTVNVFRFVSQLPIAGIDRALNDQPRVIIINAFQRFAREVLCELYKHKRYYPYYQLVIPAWYSDESWKERRVAGFNYTSDCSLSDIHTVLDRAIATFLLVYPRNTSAVGLSGWSADTFTDHYKAALEVSNGEVFTQYALPAFDAVYMAALAMNSSVPRLRELGLELEGFQFEDVNRSAMYVDILREEAGKVEFRGVTGPLSFDFSGQPVEVRAAVQQYRVQPSGNLSKADIGEIDYTSNRVDLNVSIGEIFPSGIPREEIVPINFILFSVMSALAVLGVAFSVVCLLFNLIFMRKKYIKLTSPLINVVTCVGAILLYGAIALLGVPTTDMAMQSALCNASLWVPSIGFTLLFGSLIVKTWRIYYIFRQINAKDFNKAKFRPPKDWMLLLVIGAMVAVDLVFFMLVTSIQLSRFYATEQRAELSRRVILTCASKGYSIVLPVLLVYKCIYLCVGLLLAFETRKVNIEALNDARFIGLSVYCCVLTCIPLMPIGILLSSQQQARYGVLAGGIFFAVTVILCLLFVPKMIGLYRRRKSDTTDAALDFAPSVDISGGGGLQHANVNALQDEIDVLKKKLYEFQTSSNIDQLVDSTVEVPSLPAL